MGYFRDNIERLAGYVPGFQPQGKDVVKLNTNENPYPPSPLVAEVLKNYDACSLRRYPSPVGAKFRTQAAVINGVSESNIICTNGGDDLLTIAFRAFCDAGRAVAYPVPTYTLYDELAELQDCPAIKIPFDSEDIFGGLAQSGASLVIFCNPNAPTGSFCEPQKISLLADKLKDKAVLLVDEAYADFAEDNCASLVKRHDNLIVLRSLSKGYSLAGLRFGYGIASEGLIDGLMKLKDSYNVDAISIEIATAAISDREYFRKNIERVIAERERLSDCLLKMGFEINPSSTNFIFARIVKPTAAQVFQQLKERGIFVRYFPVEGIDQQLRITIGTAEENNRLIDALTQIRAFVLD
jgi:histidinol-phosphate aminotransferase